MVGSAAQHGGYDSAGEDSASGSEQEDIGGEHERQRQQRSMLDLGL